MSKIVYTVDCGDVPAEKITTTLQPVDPLHAGPSLLWPGWLVKEYLASAVRTELGLSVETEAVSMEVTE